MKNLIIIILSLMLFGCAEIQQAADQAAIDATADSGEIQEIDPQPEPEIPDVIVETEAVEPEIVELEPIVEIPETVPEVVIEVVAEIEAEIEIVINDEPESAADTVDVEFDVDITADIEIVVIEPEPQTEPPVLTLINNNILYFYNGEWIIQENVDPVKCGFRCFMDGNTMVFYDDSGSTAATVDIEIDADFIQGDWMIELIDPDTAFSLGGLRKDYSQPYFKGVAVGHWSANQWKTEDLIETISGDVIAIDQAGNFHSLTEINGINYAKKILIHDFDAVARTAIIEHDSAYSVSWETNYFNGAKDWLELDGVWYSWNGYELETDLTEYANALWDFNLNVSVLVPDLQSGQNPTVIGAGVYDGSLYWIECGTGQLYKFTPENNALEAVNRLYIGDGLRLTGLSYRDSLKPVIIGGDLYFNESGSVWKLDLESGVVGLFFGGVGEVLEW